MNLIEEQRYERREHPRINIETQVSIKTNDTDSSIMGWIQNISQGGFKLKADIPLNFKDIFLMGREVFFETYEDFFKLKGKGNIRWTAAIENEAGIKFDELENKSRRFLEAFLGMF